MKNVLLRTAALLVIVLSGSYALDWLWFREHMPWIVKVLEIELVAKLIFNVHLPRVSALFVLGFTVLGMTALFPAARAAGPNVAAGTGVPYHLRRIASGIIGTVKWVWKSFVKNIVGVGLGLAGLLAGQIVYLASKSWYPDQLSGFLTVLEAVGLEPTIYSFDTKVIDGIYWTLSSLVGLGVAMWAWYKFRS